MESQPRKLRRMSFVIFKVMTHGTKSTKLEGKFNTVISEWQEIPLSHRFICYLVFQNKSSIYIFLKFKGDLPRLSHQPSCLKHF